jgi:hypothetical protein
MQREPISLSDAELDAVMAAAQPLHPMDRSAFLSSVAYRLKKPVTGPGTTNRIIREQLATKHYRYDGTVAVSVAGVARHNGRSALRNARRS